MAASIIIFVGLDQVLPAKMSESILSLVRALKGFGLTPIRFVLFGSHRHNVEMRLDIEQAIVKYLGSSAFANCMAPNYVEVESIDTQGGSYQQQESGEVITHWLATKLSELAAGMVSSKPNTESDSSGRSIEVNNGSDSGGDAATARSAFEASQSPFSSSLGCVIVIDSVSHDIPVIGEGHSIVITGDSISSKDAYKVAQIARRTPFRSKSQNLVKDEILRGVVKRYNPTKGFGFITVNNQDVFVHQSHIVSEGFRGLNVGAQVTLSIEMKNGKAEARNVSQLTPYVASYESDIVVEGAHRNAGAPSIIRKERRKLFKKSENPASEIPKEEIQKNNVGKQQKIKGKEQTIVPHPKGQLVFSEESIPYSFRAHDGTVYLFPMPVLVRSDVATASSSDRLKPIPARVVTGGFSQKSLRTRNTGRQFEILDTFAQQHQQYMLQDIRNSVYYVPYSRPTLNPSSPEFRVPVSTQAPPQAPVVPQTRPSTTKTANLKQHSPYEGTFSPSFSPPHTPIPDGQVSKSTIENTISQNTPTLTAGVVTSPRRTL